MRGAFDRLHFLGPATLLGPLGIAAAVAVDSDTSAQAAAKAFALAFFVLISGPVVTHATARAARLRAAGNAAAPPRQRAAGDAEP